MNAYLLIKVYECVESLLTHVQIFGVLFMEMMEMMEIIFLDIEVASCINTLAHKIV